MDLTEQQLKVVKEEEEFGEERAEASVRAEFFAEMEEKIERMYGQTRQLMATQFDLAKAEFSEKVNEAEKGVFRLTTGGVLAFIGLQGLLAAAILALALALPAWAAALIVGGVFALVGLVMLYAGRKSFKKLAPERTIRMMKKNMEALKEAV